MPTICKYETANVAIVISVVALLISLGTVIINGATFFENFISVNPKLSIRFEIDGLKETGPQATYEAGNINGKLFLYNGGNSSVIVNDLIPVIVPLRFGDKGLLNTIRSYPTLENVPQLTDAVNRSHLSYSSLHYNPDINNQQIRDLYLKPKDYLPVSWNALFEFPPTGNGVLRPGSDFVWAIRITSYRSDNTPFIKTIPAAIIHYKGPLQSGIINSTCFDLQYYLVPHDVM